MQVVVQKLILLSVDTSMLTPEDKEEIKRIIAEALAALPRATTVLDTQAAARSIVDVTVRAIEVFKTREKVSRWLATPVASLGDRTPLSLLSTPDGVAQVQDLLGRVEHGVW